MIMRSDLYLFQNGYVQSRSKAKELIESQNVKINGLLVKKPSDDVDELADNKVEILATFSFVSRGGLKLEAALDRFDISVEGLKAIDVGASTGGFTDCLLKRGAESVIAVDSGENQLDASLLKDCRVICVEKYNARYMKAADFPHLPDLAVMDVSFISQTLIHPALSEVLKEGGLLISLIKPQFEAGPAAIGKKGIVKHKKDREAAIKRVLYSAESCGLGCFALMCSPITGGDGNIEFLAAFRKGEPMKISEQMLKNIAEG